MSASPKRISVNRARLHAGLAAVRVEAKGRLRHAERVAVLGPCVVATVTVRGKRFVYVFTDAEVELLR